jgi:hypothetical protein
MLTRYSFDLQRRLLDRGHNVPIIFVTAYPDGVHRKQAFASANTYPRPAHGRTEVNPAAITLEWSCWLRSDVKGGKQ